jgi:hypothetical protein
MTQMSAAPRAMHSVRHPVALIGRRLDAVSTGAKLGHPVPLSNFVSDENSRSPHPAQVNVPSRFSLLSGLEPRGSVPCWRNT